MLSLAQQLLNAKADLPTSLGTAELRQLGANILRQSLFSARMTNATAVQAVREAVTRILTAVGDGTSTDNLAEARWKLKQLGQALNYDPAKGFPGEAEVPAAEAGSLRDIFSTDRLNLILKTNELMLHGAAKNIWGNEAEAREQYPAWELVRVAAVEVPRGMIRRGKGLIPVAENAWDTANGRWQAAASAAGDEEALKIFEATERMVARKDSDVWQQLGEGAGGYEDTLGNDYEPFAYNSGMGRVEVSAKEFADLGGDASGVEPAQTEFGPEKVAIRQDRFDPDILKTFIKGLESGDIKYRVRVEVIK